MRFLRLVFWPLEVTEAKMEKILGENPEIANFGLTELRHSIPQKKPHKNRHSYLKQNESSIFAPQNCNFLLVLAKFQKNP